MSSVTLTVGELASVVIFAVALASTDPAAISRLAVAALAKRAGLKPREIEQFEAATDGDSGGN